MKAFCARSAMAAKSLFVASLLIATSVTAEAEPGGIVAIGGSVTEIIYALGEEDQLIARDTTSTYPEAATQLPDVGYIRALSPEGVLSINPKKIVALEGAGPPETLDVLKKSSVPVVLIPDDHSREGIVAKIVAVGDAIGTPDKAKALAEKVETAVAEAQHKADGLDEPPRVLFVLSLTGGRVLAAGKNTSAASIIEMAGGINALEEIEGFKPISDEAAITAAPDVILMMERRGNHAITDELLKSHPALAATPAIKNGRFVAMGGLYLLGFGPRTAEAIGELSEALHGKGG